LMQLQPRKRTPSEILRIADPPEQIRDLRG
jgi:hypothetical protein